ncbi:penicillin-binding transpeptidase domain-containing protein [Listeria aquatica]|uniref:Penicillin-binding protein n=1 Tax=Listeria aquatica FSL S10-1188 TaxID=1265818 RepID=W7BKZ8_9LIST|nr:penicillin-binding transpeptidase domain-containing protein [Listeria aquatica]EUJ20588.1 penicillin-binding protein [Listeria aquatica FSL S10-1188]
MKQPIYKRKSWQIAFGVIIILLIVVAVLFFIFLNQSADKKAERTAESFTTNLKKGHYDKLAEDVTKDSLKESQFSQKQLQEKYQAVYGGVGVQDITVKNLKVKPGANSRIYNLSYELSMRTSLGKLKTQRYKTTISNDNDEWKINWKPALIFPGMVADDKVRLETDEARRGDIVDRNGKKLATMGDFYEVGVVPELLTSGAEKNKRIEAISKEIDIPAKEINEALKQKWVKEDSFVPLKTVFDGVKSDLIGIAYAQKVLRTYPLNQASAHLLGYIGEVSAEDIKKNPQLKVGDVIGKAGLERYYDKDLRGESGGIIKIVNDRTKHETTLQKVARKDGQTVKLTIDANLQQKIYTGLSKETGAASVINPQNGELLALVSTPSYDANQLAAGIRAEDYKTYSEDERMPFLARYSARYAPGSTFKTITASIGLDLGVTKPDKVRKIDGLKWQKDASWGKYSVTRVHDKSSVNMVDALVYSDNIYFAQEGLEIGARRFETELKKFNFGEKYTHLPVDMKAAQISNDGLKSEILLADTAYGQGQLLMSPIEQAAAYSAIANGGKTVYPKLTVSQQVKNPEQAVKKESADIVKEALVKTVSDPNGTAHGLAVSGKNLAAKTGTAELKQKQGEDGDENGFLYAFNADHPDALLVGMVEDVKGRGGSSLVIDRLKNVIATF